MLCEEAFINWYRIKSVQLLFKFLNIILILLPKAKFNIHAGGRQIPNSQNVGQVQPITVINKTETFVCYNSASLSALKAYNSRSWPGGAAIWNPKSNFSMRSSPLFHISQPKSNIRKIKTRLDVPWGKSRSFTRNFSCITVSM